MKRTNTFKGAIFKLKENAQTIQYSASFDITAHTALLNGTSVHLAFVQDCNDDCVVSFYILNNKPPIICHHTRSCDEIITGIPNNRFGKIVFPEYFNRLLAKCGLTEAEYRDLVEEARFILNSS